MTKGMGSQFRQAIGELAATLLGAAISLVVGTAATVITPPASARALVLRAEKGAFRVRLGARIGGDITASAATDEIALTGHGMETGEGPIQFKNTAGALPAPLAAGTDYYVVEGSDADHFKLATSYDNATAETPVTIDLTDAGSGTNTMVAFPAAADAVSTDTDVLVAGQGSAKIAEGQQIILPGPVTVTVKGYANTDVLSYWSV